MVPKPRWWLNFQAVWWRLLARMGNFLHGFPRPHPLRPSFNRTFKAASDETNSNITIEFYVPAEYQIRKKQGKRYPVVVSLHGGGFTLGRATDDGRWARIVLDEIDCIFVSVEYRLAPKFPFPTAVDDGVDALLYLAEHSGEFAIDPSRMALSGFSAGGNLSFTVPLRLFDKLEKLKAAKPQERPKFDRMQSSSKLLSESMIPTVVCLISWYPSLDYTLSREQRRATSKLPGKTLPKVFTDLFDEAYLPENTDLSSPFISPAVAPDDLLVKGLPDEIAMYLCEWDMLLEEGENFAKRLVKLGKKVKCITIAEAVHGFDRAPNPIRVNPMVKLKYLDACSVIRDSFGEHRKRSLREGSIWERTDFAGQPLSGPRGASIDISRVV